MTLQRNRMYRTVQNKRNVSAKIESKQTQTGLIVYTTSYSIDPSPRFMQGGVPQAVQ